MQEIAAAHPGHSVELRVPPFGAVQIVEGPRHTRGTPPAVVEIPPLAWVRLATGGYSWADACTDGDIQASGVRSDLSALLPVVAFRPAPKSALDEGTADADGPGTLLS